MPEIIFSSMHGAVLARQGEAADNPSWHCAEFAASFPRKLAAETWWVTWDEPARGLLPPEVPFARRILCLTEPPEYKDYSLLLPEHRYILSPFAIHPSALRPGSTVIRVPPLINWFYGHNLKEAPGSGLELGALKAEPVPQKQRRMALVCSRIATLPAHRQRVAFVDLLRKLFKDRIDFYGKGLSFVADKREAIAPYRYLIALENNFHPHFWTEKVSDALLGRAVPIYAGCPNLADYFPSESFIRIDYREPDRAVDTIAGLLAQPADADYQARRPFLEEARERLFNHYNAATALPRLLKRLAEAPDADPLSLAKAYLNVP